MSRVDCVRVEQLLSRYLDRVLDAKASRAISLHLAVCDACRIERDSLERLSQWAASLELERPRPGLADRVRAQRTSGTWVRRMGAAALAITSLFAAYALGRQQRTTPTPESRLLVVEQGLPVPAADEAPDRVSDQAFKPLQRATRIGADNTLAFALPSDELAVRAASALLADLELLDRVPVHLHAPLLRPQVERYGLARWAEERASTPAFSDLAELLQQLDRELEGGIAPVELAALRTRASQPGFWDPAFAALGQQPDYVPIQRPITGQYALDVSSDTRDSLGRWVSFKDDWIRGARDMHVLHDLIDGLGPALTGDGDSAFQLPNLGGLYDRLNWTVDEDGTRHGRLDLRTETEHGFSVLQVEVSTSSN